MNFKNTVLLLLVACMTGLLTGCVERSLLITSEPEQSDVYLDGEYLGATPVEVPFTYYAEREIRVEKFTAEGDTRFQPVVLNHQLHAPFYQWIPFDFVAENLLPFHFIDKHHVHVVLPETKKLSEDQANALLDELLNRADALRRESHGK